MRRPSTRRDSKKIWKMEHSHERNATGMRDEPMSKGVENDDEQMDFQSAADSSHNHCRLFASLGITAIAVVLAGCLSTFRQRLAEVRHGQAKLVRRLIASERSALSARPIHKLNSETFQLYSFNLP
ncbi:unnamed protein product, partial [Heterotrigona itama]